MQNRGQNIVSAWERSMSARRFNPFDGNKNRSVGTGRFASQGLSNG